MTLSNLLNLLTLTRVQTGTPYVKPGDLHSDNSIALFMDRQHKERIIQTLREFTNAFTSH